MFRVGKPRARAVTLVITPRPAFTVAEVVERIAKALHPGDGLVAEMSRQETARAWRRRIEGLVSRGQLTVLSAMTRLEHEFPVGRALDDAVMTRAEIDRLLEHRAIRFLFKAEPAPKFRHRQRRRNRHRKGRK